MRLHNSAAAIFVLLAVTAPAATRFDYTVVEYVLPHKGPPPAFAHDPAVAPDGMVWFADQQSSYIGRLNPKNGAVKNIRRRLQNRGRTALSSRRTA